MKLSKYNRFYVIDGRYFIYNALNSSLAEFEQNVFVDLKENRMNAPGVCECLDDLKINGFAIEDNENELDILHHRISDNRLKSIQNELLITIIPTLNCNFKCVYCYQNRHPDEPYGILNLQIQDKIVDLIETSDAQEISVLWYGGEPMLKMDTIDHLSAKIQNCCSRVGKKLKFSIITNGSELTKENIEVLIKRNIRSIQLTIDGPQNIHNARRREIHGLDSYSIMMNFLRSAEADFFEINIRVNVDKCNFNFIGDFLAELSSLNRSNLTIDFAPVEYFSHHCEKNLEQMFSTSEFYKIDQSLRKAASSLGLLKENNIIEYPQAIECYCGATQGNSIVIDSKGYVYQCLSDVIDSRRSIGNLSNCQSVDSLLRSGLSSSYLKESYDFSDICMLCDILPLCHGGCLLKKHLGNPECPSIKYSIDHDIEAFIRSNYF